MSAEGRRPICQDTGIVVVFLEVGMDVRWESDMGVEEMVNEGVRRGYTNVDNLTTRYAARSFLCRRICSVRLGSTGYCGSNRQPPARKS